MTLHLYFVSEAYTTVFNGGEKSVFFKAMKRLLVWKPRNLNRFPFLFLEYYFSSAAMKSELDTFLKKTCFNKKKEKKNHLALDDLINFESLKYR